ncbi:MAG: right-handed parallel beta-helix repeat-containing protein [Epsilonproteobacteria bacterium]|nr:right-handed parallel beta-helix repeat-containing protein [Campylobacterota bacterium]
MNHKIHSHYFALFALLMSTNLNAGCPFGFDSGNTAQPKRNTGAQTKTISQKNPTPQAPGSIDLSDAVAITQADFDSGTYRIKTPGYYYLKEDIAFEPSPGAEAGRADKPTRGWFAVISIETDNVTLDLNQKTIETTTDFVNAHNFKLFSIIELANAAFPTPPKDLEFTAFAGETEFISANNVVVRNGTLGRSSHHGIHGNFNDNIQVHDLVVRDWEVGGIAFNNLISGQIKNCMVSGSQHEIKIKGDPATLHDLRRALVALEDGGDANATPHREAIDKLIADPVANGTASPIPFPDGNMYGIFINNFLDVGPRGTEKACLELEQLHGFTHGHCVEIENVSVCNIQAALRETVGMAGYTVREGKVARLTMGPNGVFGTLRWEDAYPSGTFAPNAILKAQVYAVNAADPDGLPAGFAANILSATPSEALFKTHVTPVFGEDLAGHFNKGIFGIRLDCVDGISIKNCNVSGLENKGVTGIVLSDLAGGANYPDFEQKRYKGNDVWGISLSYCNSCLIKDCAVNNCTTSNGDVVGVSCLNGSSANLIENCYTGDMHSQHDSEETIVNPTGRSIGFLCEEGSNSNLINNCDCALLSSYRSTFGFTSRNCLANRFEDCKAYNLRAHATDRLDDPKQAVGFESEASKCTQFLHCEAVCMACTGESAERRETDSQAAGFLLCDNKDEVTDKKSLIKDCVSRCHNGGAGEAFGICLSGAECAALVGNTTALNDGDSPANNSFGIKDFARQSTSLVTKNIAYANEQNYYVTYANSSGKLLVTESSYDDLDSLISVNAWENIALDKRKDSQNNVRPPRPPRPSRR